MGHDPGHDVHFMALYVHKWGHYHDLKLFGARDLIVLR